MLDIQYVLVGAVSLLILLLIIVQGRKDQNQNERKKYFDYLIGVTVIFCLIDIFWGLVVSGTILSSDWIVFATTLFYFSSTVVAFALLVFVIAYFTKKEFKDLVLSFKILTNKLLKNNSNKLD